MLPVLAGLALVGAGVWIYKELQDSSSSERTRWINKREEVQHSIEYHRAQVTDHLNTAQASYDFQVLVGMHYSCVKVANEAYQLLNDARTRLDKLNQAILKTKEQLNWLITRKKAVHDRQEKDNIQAEIDSLRVLRAQLFSDKDELKQQRDEFYSQVKELNSKTHTLKLCIKDRTGSKGADWYDRLESRKRLHS